MELTVVKIVENRGLWCVKWQRWVKEQQSGLFADRTSCSVFHANELRLKFSSLAYVLCMACVVLA